MRAATTITNRAILIARVGINKAELCLLKGSADFTIKSSDKEFTQQKTDHLDRESHVFLSLLQGVEKHF